MNVLQLYMQSINERNKAMRQNPSLYFITIYTKNKLTTIILLLSLFSYFFRRIFNEQAILYVAYCHLTLIMIICVVLFTDNFMHVGLCVRILFVMKDRYLRTSR